MFLNVGDRVSPGFRFPFKNSPSNLHRNCIGMVVSANEQSVVVDWNPLRPERPQKYTYGNDDTVLMRVS